MRDCIKLLLILFLPSLALAQPNHSDSLRKILANAVGDSAIFNATMNLSLYYEELNIDSSLYFADQAFLIAQRNNHLDDEAVALNSKGYQLLTLGKYRESLKCLLKAFSFVEKPGNENNKWAIENRLYTLSTNHHMFGLLMNATENTEQEIFHYKEAIRIGKEINDSFRIRIAYSNLAGTYESLGILDSALVFAKKAEAISMPSAYKKYGCWLFFELGKIYFKLGDARLAKLTYYEGIASATEQNNQSGLASIYNEFAKLYLSKEKKDSSLYYSIQTIRNLNALGYVGDITNNIGTAYENLYLSYKLNDQFDSAFKYQGLALIAKDSLYKKRIENIAAFQNLTFSEQLRLQNLEKEKSLYQNKVRIYTLLAGLGMFLVIALILYRNNRQKHKTNKVLEKTLDNLKSTQSQLIQSEKMASLGELTAGIAHEIQNPLNFVNNFSEVNKELLVEMKEEMNKGHLDEANLIAYDVIANEEKINHHGKRADAIVKGMLQHSRSSSGVKEPTDINALADEYIRLCYHGLRAKDKLFNAAIKTDFDDAAAKINIIPQDIGRVLLNLFNNAFYSVNEKSISVRRSFSEGGQASSASADKKYQPTVTVSTKKINDTIQITVRDNGMGIPQDVMNKIFQPFFTTKPTGQGTGLGLSLSFDIIKAHGGEIKVVSLGAGKSSNEVSLTAGDGNEEYKSPEHSEGLLTEQAGAEFIILLPVN